MIYYLTIYREMSWGNLISTQDFNNKCWKVKILFAVKNKNVHQHFCLISSGQWNKKNKTSQQCKEINSLNLSLLTAV
jgi:hypothetical protein